MPGDIIRQAIDIGETFLSRADQLPVLDQPSPPEIRSHLAEAYTFAHPVDSGALVEDVGQMLERWSVHTVHPRYFGYFNPTPLPEAVAAQRMLEERRVVGKVAVTLD